MIKEFYGDFWEFPADARVITTNGFVKNNGDAVMGAGVAKAAAIMYPRLPMLLGQHITENGNTPRAFGVSDSIILTFPVKHAWYESADIELIEHSALEIKRMIERNHLYSETFVSVRPGCGNGKLDWADVAPVLQEAWIGLDNMYVVEFP